MTLRNIVKNLRGGKLLKSDSSKNKLTHKYAFTLAEVLLVLVILGVIAAITMPTLNLSGNKEKALEVKAMKVLGDIDKALDLIKFNDSSGSLAEIYDPYGSGSTFSISNGKEHDKLKAVLAKYLKITNKPCNDSSCYCYNAQRTEYSTPFYLNNGACVSFVMSHSHSTKYVIPGSGFCGDENYDVRVVARIHLDVNGPDGPNQDGVDRFRIPLQYSGIDYQCRQCNVTNCSTCDPTNPDKCIDCLDYEVKNLVVYKCDCSLEDNGATCNCDDKCTPLE